MFMCCQATWLNLKISQSSAIKNVDYNECPQSQWVSRLFQEEFAGSPEKVPNEGKIVFKAICLSFNANPCTSTHCFPNQCRQGDQMYLFPSHEVALSKVRGSSHMQTHWSLYSYRRAKHARAESMNWRNRSSITISTSRMKIKRGWECMPVLLFLEMFHLNSDSSFLLTHSNIDSTCSFFVC